jgi:hypothetical protein
MRSFRSLMSGFRVRVRIPAEPKVQRHWDSSPPCANHSIESAVIMRAMTTIESSAVLQVYARSGNALVSAYILLTDRRKSCLLLMLASGSSSLIIPDKLRTVDYSSSELLRQTGAVAKSLSSFYFKHFRSSAVSA